MMTGKLQRANLINRGFFDGLNLAKVDRVALMLGLVALAVYFPALWWGLPHASSVETIHGWDVDSVTGVATLAEIHNLFGTPSPDWWVAYPLWHYLVLAIVYAPYIVFLLLTGGLSNPSPIYPYGFTDPVGAIASLTLLGRAVTWLMAGGIVATTFLIARTVWDSRFGIIAASIVMLTHPMLYYARTGNLDIPVLFWTVLGILPLAQSLRFGLTGRRAAWMGICAALAVATKDQAYGAWLPALGFVLIAHWRIKPRSWAPLWVLILTGIVVYAFASGLLINPQRFIAHMKFTADYENYVDVRQLDLLRPATLEGYAYLGLDILQAAVEALGPIFFIVALIGVLATRLSLKLHLVLLLMLAGHILLVILPIRHVWYRWILFPAFAMVFLTVHVLFLGWQRGGWVRMATAVLGVIGFLWLGARGADLTFQMLFDARYQAAAWLEQNARPGDRIAFTGAIEQLPPLPDGVEVDPIPNGDAAFAAIGRRESRFFIVSPDWSSDATMEHSRFLAPTVYARLEDGSLGYTLLARFEKHSLLTIPMKYFASVNPPVQIFSTEVQ